MAQTKLNYKKLFGLGILIWAIAYLVACIFVAYKTMDSLIAGIVVVIALALAAFFAGRSLKLSSVVEILKYSICWVIIAFILDLILTVPFTGWGIFSSWHLIVGYLLIIFLPLLSVKK